MADAEGDAHEQQQRDQWDHPGDGPDDNLPLAQGGAGGSNESGGKDDWVACDKCGKWRRVPGSIPLETLTSQAWYCAMAHWDALVSSAGCAAPEEDWSAGANANAPAMPPPIAVPLAVAAGGKGGAKKGRASLGGAAAQQPQQSAAPATASKADGRKGGGKKGRGGKAAAAASSTGAAAPGGFPAGAPSGPVAPLSAPQSAAAASTMTGGSGAPAAGQAQSRKRKRQVEWVQCENASCNKWRKLPPHMSMSDLPDSAWYCSMNSWDPARASCDAPEETADAAEVTLALVDSATTTAAPAASRATGTIAQARMRGLSTASAFGLDGGSAAVVGDGSLSSRSHDDAGAAVNTDFEPSPAVDSATGLPFDDASALGGGEASADAPGSTAAYDSDGNLASYSGGGGGGTASDADVDMQQQVMTSAATIMEVGLVAADSGVDQITSSSSAEFMAAAATATTKKRRKKESAAAKAASVSAAAGSGSGGSKAAAADAVPVYHRSHATAMSVAAANLPLTPAIVAASPHAGYESVFVKTAGKPHVPLPLPPSYVHGNRDYAHMLLLHPPEVWAHPGSGGGVAREAVRAAREQALAAGVTTQAPPPGSGAAHKIAYRDLVATAWGSKAKVGALSERSHAAIESNLRWTRSSVYAQPSAAGRDHTSLLTGEIRNLHAAQQLQPSSSNSAADASGGSGGLNSFAPLVRARLLAAATLAPAASSAAKPPSVQELLAVLGRTSLSSSSSANPPSSTASSPFDLSAAALELAEAVIELRDALAAAQASDAARSKQRRLAKRELAGSSASGSSSSSSSVVDLVHESSSSSNSNNNRPGIAADSDDEDEEEEREELLVAAAQPPPPAIELEEGEETPETLMSPSSSAAGAGDNGSSAPSAPPLLAIGCHMLLSASQQVLEACAEQLPSSAPSIAPLASAACQPLPACPLRKIVTSLFSPPGIAGRNNANSGVGGDGGWQRIYRAGQGGSLTFALAGQGPRNALREGGGATNHDAGHLLAVSDLEIISESRGESNSRFSGVAAGLQAALGFQADRAVLAEAADRTQETFNRLQREWEQWEERRMMYEQGRMERDQRRMERLARREARAAARAAAAAAAAAAATATASANANAAAAAAAAPATEEGDAAMTASSSTPADAADVTIKPDAEAPADGTALPSIVSTAPAALDGDDADAADAAADAEADRQDAEAEEQALAELGQPALSPDDAIRRLRSVFGEPQAEEPHVISGDNQAGMVGYLWRPPFAAFIGSLFRERTTTAALVLALAGAEAVAQLASSSGLTSYNSVYSHSVIHHLAPALKRLLAALSLVLTGASGASAPDVRSTLDRLTSAPFLSAWLTSVLGLPSPASSSTGASDGGLSGSAAAASSGDATSAAIGGVPIGSTAAGSLSIVHGLGPFAIERRLRALVGAGVATAAAAASSPVLPSDGGFSVRLTPAAAQALARRSAAAVVVSSSAPGSLAAVASPRRAIAARLRLLLVESALTSLTAPLTSLAAKAAAPGSSHSASVLGGSAATAAVAGLGNGPRALSHMLPLKAAKPWKTEPV